MKQKILDFVSSEVNRGKYPNQTEIDRKFHISIYSYFRSLKEVYESAGFDYNNIKKLKMMKKGNLIRKKKLRFRKKVGRKRIIEYIRKEAQKGHFPGRHEIQEKFNIWFFTYFKSIKEAYKLAKIDFRKGIRNPFIYLDKEEKLIKIIVKLLEKMNFELIRISKKRGTDILVRNRENKIIPIELKAYHRNSNLPLSNGIDKNGQNEIEQLKKYIKIYKAPYGILITTTNRIRIKIPKNIKLINGNELIFMLKKYKLSYHISTIDWIRNTYSSFDRIIHETEIKKKIKDYVKRQVNNKHYPTMREIQERFGINIGTYFSGGMKELYKMSAIKLPPRYLSKKEVRRQIVDYIIKNKENGIYTSIEKIERKFKIHLKSYFKNLKEAYKYANIKIPPRHESKDNVRNSIIYYIKKQMQKGEGPKVHEINKEFNINFYTYFSSMKRLKKKLLFS